MNISGLLRSIMGESQPADAKTLELKVGQIVKGIVLQLLSEQDALVNINGVQVRAKLEAPLKQGESTLLQVQPESVGGQPVLKPLQGSTTQIADASFPGLLKELGQKDTGANRQLVLTLQREGVPLTKESVALFVDALKAKPAKVSAEEWMQTAALAYKRGLPLTAEAMGALRQTLSGPPLYELVQRLGAEAEAQLERLPDAVRQPVQQLAALVRQALGEAAAHAGGGFAEAAPPQQALPRAASAAAGESGGVTPPPARAGAEPPAPAAGLRPPAAAPVPAAAAVPTPPQAPLGAARTTAAPSPAAAAARPAAGEPPPVRAAQPQAPAAPPAQPGAGAGASASAAGSAAPPPAAAEPDHWIGRMLKALGVEHERELLRLPDKPEPLLAKLAPQQPAGAGIGAESAPSPAGDTLKGLLLQLAASDDVPAALKDTMQQTLQQITGQQLLLAPDRNAPFAQVTLFVPFRDDNGQQTASVHIQSRRGSRGQLDANNCRLLFDLYMNQMGNTLLDVQVVDRVVSLSVRNDHPAVPTLLDGYREEIVQALQGAGYQLLSLNYGPYPTPADYKEDTAATAETQTFDPSRSQLKSLMQTKPYKGVDLRV